MSYFVKVTVEDDDTLISETVVDETEDLEEAMQYVNTLLSALDWNHIETPDEPTS